MRTKKIFNENPSLTEKLNSRIRNTVGYSESENKAEFIKGANVGINKAEEFLEDEIIILKNELDSLSTKYYQLLSDMKIFTNIIKKYSEE